ncbi:sporulation protein [Halomarina rubra]|uniref:Sporulation protein n=1 Tax=Halomarina rubra TaxID=2071873 RepID=A0ABD6B120_9EURY|nr:sporulation protein [Halomarina rubra]
MKRILARVGIGAATVDTVLPTTTLTQGETVDAQVEMHGGSTSQDIDAIYFALKTRYRDDEGYSTTTLSRKRVTDPFTLDAEEERTVDVSFDVPRETPVTMGKTQVWLDTGLDVKGALDPDDRDHVEVQPGTHLDALFDALEELGFGFYKSSCEATGGMFSQRFAQEFEFRPRSGPFAGSFDELEVVATPTDGGLDVLMEVDRRGGLLAEMTDTDERYERFSVTHTDVGRLADEVRSVVEHHA